MKTLIYNILFVIVLFSCKTKKNSTKQNAEQPAFYNLMTEGDTLIIFRKHLYYWNDRGPMGEGRTYNEFIQRFIITKTATEIVYGSSLTLDPEQFPDTLKFDLFQNNIKYFDDLFDLNPACDDSYTSSDHCWDSFALTDPLAQLASEQFQEFEKGWPEYYALNEKWRVDFLKRQFESDYNFFDVIMHFRGRVRRFYSTTRPVTTRGGWFADEIKYPPGQKPIGKIKK
jgi:hypothetical protein